MASPKAKTESEGAKTGMNKTTAIQTINSIIVGRHPNLSWVYALTKRPANWPTRAEFDKPDCHLAGIACFPVFGSWMPNRVWNCVWP
jgi:hypothetical protein